MLVLGFIYLASGVVLSTTGLMNVSEGWGFGLLFVGCVSIVCGAYQSQLGLKKLINK